jgi:hypothetical protein
MIKTVRKYPYVPAVSRPLRPDRSMKAFGTNLNHFIEKNLCYPNNDSTFCMKLLLKRLRFSYFQVGLKKLFLYARFLLADFRLNMFNTS